MKKNVKYLGAAAAALLAVAPVVASTTVAHAEVSANGTVPTVTAPEKKYVIDVASSMAAQSQSTSVSSLTTQAAVTSAMGLKTGNVISMGSAAVVNSKGQAVTSLTAGENYTLQATVAIGGLESGKTYTVQQQNANGTVSKFSKLAENGVLQNVFVSIPFHVYDAAVQGQPYFVDMTTASHVNLANGAFAYKAKNFTSGETLDQIEAEVRSAVVPKVNTADATGSVITKTLNYNFGDLKSQLANQGVTVKDNKISASASSFYVTVSTVNPENNKTASVKVQFTKAANEKLYPAIYQNNTKVMQGTVGKGIGNPSYAQGSDAAKAVAKDPIAALGLSAYTVDNIGSGHIDLKVLSNKIDPNKVGVYPVTLTATNPNGYTTNLSFNVVINPSIPGKGRQATIKYKAGYGVNVWNVLSSSNVSFSGDRVMDGETVNIIGEKNVNGMKYYYVEYGNKNSKKGYVQAQYIDGTSATTPSTKPSTSTKEEAMSGVIVVKYNGRGKVALVDQNGHYGTGNYVAKNAAFKVFAKKTINGKTYYRLGTQSQWIPAQYAMFR